jgi:hypothetical protein
MDYYTIVLIHSFIPSILFEMDFLNTVTTEQATSISFGIKICVHVVGSVVDAWIVTQLLLLLGRIWKVNGCDIPGSRTSIPP